MRYVFRKNDCLSCTYEFSNQCCCEYLQSVNLETGVCDWTTYPEWAQIFDDKMLIDALVYIGFRKQEVNESDEYTTIIEDHEIPFDIGPPKFRGILCESY